MSAFSRFQFPLALLKRALQAALQALEFRDLSLDGRQLLVEEVFNV